VKKKIQLVVEGVIEIPEERVRQTFSSEVDDIALIDHVVSGIRLDARMSDEGTRLVLLDIQDWECWDTDE
jgi:hypothetical protein